MQNFSSCVSLNFWTESVWKPSLEKWYLRSHETAIQSTFTWKNLLVQIRQSSLCSHEKTAMQSTFTRKDGNAVYVHMERAKRLTLRGCKKPEVWSGHCKLIALLHTIKDDQRSRENWICMNGKLFGNALYFIHKGFRMLNADQSQTHKHKDTNTNTEKDRETKRQIQWSGLSGLAIIVLMAPHLFQSRPAPPAVSPLNLSPKCYNYKYNHKHKDKYKYKHTNTHTPKCPVAPIKRQQIIQNTLACMLNFLKLLILQIQ